MLRKVIFWLHLSAGLIAGAVILIMSATGVLLTYEKQIIAWADRSDLARPPLPTSKRQPVDALIEAARRGDPSLTVATLAISSLPGAPALATAGERVIRLNPYTGDVLGESAPLLRGFFRNVTTWHRYLGAGNGPLRQVLRNLTGWSNFLFLLILIGGAYLWTPRRWRWSQVRAVAVFRGGLAGKARDFNWHNVIGIWSAVPLGLIVLGALPISFQWANKAVYQVVGEEPPTPQGPLGAPTGGRGRGTDGPTGHGGAGREGSHRDASTDGGRVDLEPLWQKAERQVAGWRTISARIGGSGPLAFTIDTGTGGRPQGRGTLTVDRATGDVVRWEPFDSQSNGRRFRTFLRFAHTGEYFGVMGQTIAGLASAGGVVLVWTGMALALRRFSAWHTSRRMAAPSASPRSHAA